MYIHHVFIFCFVNRARVRTRLLFFLLVAAAAAAILLLSIVIVYPSNNLHHFCVVLFCDVRECWLLPSICLSCCVGSLREPHAKRALLISMIFCYSFSFFFIYSNVVSRQAAGKEKGSRKKL